MSLTDFLLTPILRKELDATPIGTLLSAHPDYRTVTHYAEGQGYWKQGEGAPSLVLDPVTGQAAGRCMASRVRGLGVAMPGSIHPKPCAWCATASPLLLRSLDHAVFVSRYVASEVYVWPTRSDPYVRDTGRAGVYENPAWASFFALSREDRRDLVEAAMYPVAVR